MSFSISSGNNFRIFTNNYVINGPNVVMDGNVDIRGNLFTYLDSTLNSLPENSISIINGLTADTNKW